MKRQAAILFLLCLSLSFALAQGTLRGHIVDKTSNEALQFVNAVVLKHGSVKPFASALSDGKGSFRIDKLPFGSYDLRLTFMGYKTVERQFSITKQKPNASFSLLYMSEDMKQLQGVVVTGQRGAMRLEVDRKSFDVKDQVSVLGGVATDVLENIPSVEVDQDGNVSLRGNSSVEIWINGKSSGLTSDNRAEILQQLPAESIERVEVIDNPSAKFSAEGSAGIINIILKKDRKAGYYGSVQAGANTIRGANGSVNMNYSSSKVDAYASLSLRRHVRKAKALSKQENFTADTYEDADASSHSAGNMLFSRFGLTLHLTGKDDILASMMAMHGTGRSSDENPYLYGTLSTRSLTHSMLRQTRQRNSMNMLYGELSYRHNFSEKHFLDFTADISQWRMSGENTYQDSTTWVDGAIDTEYQWQSAPMRMNNRRMEMKLDYENQLSDDVKLEAGYMGNFSREKSPQETYSSPDFQGSAATLDEALFNRFTYDMDLHAAYTTLTMKFGKFGIMAGLRGEYWRVKTKSLDYAQAMGKEPLPEAFKKDYFRLFPSLFLSWQVRKNDQLQLNYTRRLKRPWGGQLNSFRDTRDASVTSFGNPLLTPEYSHSLSMNYLKTWLQHSLMLSLYYRPTKDVMQRITYQNKATGRMFRTPKNVAKSLSTGFEAVAKNKLCRQVDLTTTLNAYYYKLNAFAYNIEGQDVHGPEQHNFTWNMRSQVGIILPYDISVQATGRYRARRVTSQGYNRSNIGMDLGVRKSFLNKALNVALNCRDVFNSRRHEGVTLSETFRRWQKHTHNSRSVNLSLTYNFGNMKPRHNKKDQPDGQSQEQHDDGEGGAGFQMGGE